MKLVNKNIEHNNVDNALNQAQLFLFLFGMTQTASILYVADKTGIVNEAISIVSIISAVIFFVLAFIVRKNSL